MVVVQGHGLVAILPAATGPQCAMPRQPLNLHRAYHAHVYFDAQSVGQARALCEEAGRRFQLAVGRVHEKNVGPHPRWSCQIAFSAAQFDRVVPWLEAHREGLDVLVHGLTGDDIRDHTEFAYWLGNDWPLDLSALNPASPPTS
jgi:aromatic ring-cleaving dioxygenase